MKIGITVNSYYPHKDGVQFITQSLAERLVSDGHNLTVITCLAEGYNTTEDINGVSVRRYDIRNIAMLFVGDKKGYQKKVLELSQNVDMMIFVGLQRAATGWILPILDRIPCKKILYVHGIHNFRFEKMDFFSIKNFAMKIARNIRWKSYFMYYQKSLKKMDATIQLHEKDDGYKFFETIIPGKNNVLMNFAEPIFLDNQNRFHKKNQFIYIGNYTYCKNQQLLLKAFYRMKKDASLVLIGSEKNNYYFKLLNLNNSLANKYGNRDVKILYGVDRNSFPELLGESKAFVMTSYSEKFPIAIIEAMSVGTPFICTDVGIVKYLKGGVVVGYDEEKIASKMDEFIADTSKYDKIQDEACKYSKEKFNMDNYMAKLYKIIEQGEAR